MTGIFKSRGIGEWRRYAGSACWIKKTRFKVYEDSSQYKRNKVRMSEVEDQDAGIIWIVSYKTDPRSGLYCN